MFSLLWQLICAIGWFGYLIAIFLATVIILTIIGLFIKFWSWVLR